MEQMEKRFDKIDDKLDKIEASMHQIALDHSNRITKLEARQKGIITVLSSLWVALISGCGIILKKLGVL